MPKLLHHQDSIVKSPLEKTYLEGPVGTGKTTVGVERMLYLIRSGIPADTLLVIVPQRTLANPYLDALNQSNELAGGIATILTVGGLARRMIDLFWPLIAEEAGFAHPNQEPIFLTLETAQYYMAHLIRPLLDYENLFTSVHIPRNRLYSQILDNLNKAAVNGYSHTEIGERLKKSWVGDPGQASVYDDAQYCANLYRKYCLEHNLLDFSLQIEIFFDHLWPYPICQEYLLEKYNHLIADNQEEDTPITHDLLIEWLPYFQSALIIIDQDAGYRRFLGADPKTAFELKKLCDVHTVFSKSFVTSSGIEEFGNHISSGLNHTNDEYNSAFEITSSIDFPNEVISYYPQMLDWVISKVHDLISSGVSPGEVVILAPYLGDSLRFSLVERLSKLDIPSRSHRPSRALRDEPAVQCLLTLSTLAHPNWDTLPSKYDITYALVEGISDMDLVRAQLLTEIVYRLMDGKPDLTSFNRINPKMQERLTYLLGQRYENLRRWIYEYRQTPMIEFDHFLSRLFGEVLAQPGYRFHDDYNAGQICANLVESVQKFRWAAGDNLADEDIPLGKEYIEMVKDGVIAAQYIQNWQIQFDEAVFLAPAYTFLMANRPVDYQIWLDIGSRGWYERLYQPITHPYVLSRHWSVGQPWTDANEMDINRESLYRLTLGLIRRCRKGIILGFSQYSEGGYEQEGLLLKGINHLLRKITFEPPT